MGGMLPILSVTFRRPGVGACWKKREWLSLPLLYLLEKSPRSFSGAIQTPQCGGKAVRTQFQWESAPGSTLQRQVTMSQAIFNLH